MKHWPGALFAIIVGISGCASPTAGPGALPSGGVKSGTGRYFVLRDFGLAYTQIDAVTPAACFRLRNELRNKLAATSPQSADCENVDQSENLPYSLKATDASGATVQLKSFNRALCTGWVRTLSGTQGVKVDKEGCQLAQDLVKGKRFFQVLDGGSVAFAQMDFGTEANCRQFEKIRSTASPQGNGSARFACADASQSRDMKYTIRLVSDKELPVIEVEARDKDICEMLARGSPEQYAGARPECTFNQ
ncbi:hypothetical protein [Variovorax sp. GT1P44]|uniref:hypothetical protein n=1 Tax=Variovorax sp. GT1P44 TaxID=3443742 RepID=UPI003F48FD29